MCPTPSSRAFGLSRFHSRARGLAFAGSAFLVTAKRVEVNAATALPRTTGEITGNGGGAHGDGWRCARQQKTARSGLALKNENETGTQRFMSRGGTSPARRQIQKSP